MRKVYTVDDELVQIHTTITEKEREDICSKGWEYNELIRLGMIAKKEQPQIGVRISTIEKKMEVFEQRLLLLQESNGVKRR